MRSERPTRPTEVFDPMVQHERTLLAWERTAISIMVAGVLLARHAATVHVTLAIVGIMQVTFGSVLLIWAGRHYDDLHGPLRAGLSPAHPAAARVIGILTTSFCAAATLVAVVGAVR